MVEAHTPQVEEEQVISIKVDLNRRPKARRHSKTIPTKLVRLSKQVITTWLLST